MNLKITTVLFLFTVLSCKSQNDLKKDKTFISELETSQSIIKLFTNNKFEYSNKEKLANQSSRGSWKKDGKKIFLTSDDIYKSGVIECYEYENNSLTTEIIVFDTDDNFLIDAGITINDDEKTGWNVNENGVVSFQKKEINKITIHYLGKKYSYIVNRFDANKYVLKVRVEDLSFKYFNNELFTLKDSELINTEGRVFKLSSD